LNVPAVELSVYHVIVSFVVETLFSGRKENLRRAERIIFPSAYLGKTNSKVMNLVVFGGEKRENSL
jgi:hypothetical protein